MPPSIGTLASPAQTLPGRKGERVMRLFDRTSESRPVSALARFLTSVWLRHLARRLRRLQRINTAALDAEMRHETERQRRSIESVLRNTEWQRLRGRR